MCFSSDLKTINREILKLFPLIFFKSSTVLSSLGSNGNIKNAS